MSLEDFIIYSETVEEDYREDHPEDDSDE